MRDKTDRAVERATRSTLLQEQEPVGLVGDSRLGTAAGRESEH
jgi:hypothetical protein